MKRSSVKLLAGLAPAGRIPSADDQCPGERKSTRRNLRTSCGKEPDFGVVIRTSISRFFTALAASFFATGGSSKRMCQNYGHVTPGRFKGEYPRCTECGILIKDPKEVRRSFLTDQVQPVSNIGFRRIKS